MDCLSREQLLLLQHNLTYEVYEEFMSMFEETDERIPDNDEDWPLEGIGMARGRKHVVVARRVCFWEKTTTKAITAM